MTTARDEIVLATRFQPAWELIEPLRNFVEAFAQQRLGSKLAEAAAMATSELLENATKYGNLMTLVEFEVRYDSRDGAIVLRVANRSQLARIRILEREFAKVTAPGGGDALRRAMERLAHLPSGTSMLGLARLAGQAEMTLDVQGDNVVLMARFSRAPLAARERDRRGADGNGR